MPKFQVLRRVDAYADYVAEVEARNEKEAAAKANEDETAFAWSPRGLAEFDTRIFVALDEAGNEVEGTEHGDF